MDESQYARDIHRILASLTNEPGDHQDDQRLPDEEEAVQEIHVYPVEGGGLLFTKEPLEEEDPPVTVIESETPAAHPGTRGEPPPFLSFVLLLLLVLVLDSADTALNALLAPSATITITPQVRTLTLQSTAKLGKLLSPITLGESQTVPATGHGHQNARQAAGTVTFYNGLATVQFVAAETILSGQDGRRVATDVAVTIPPARPPSFGERSIAAHAIQTGASGNVQAGDINTTLATGLYVKNLAAFTGGQDARDFQVITRADITTAAANLHAKVSAGMSSAIQGQLLPGQALTPTPCRPHVTANHQIGDEVSTVEVTVAESCTAIAYDTQALTAQATQLLTAQATRAFGPGYTLAGDVQVHVTHPTTLPTTPVVALAFTCQGIYAYLLNGQAQQRIKTLLSGKSRLAALHWLKQQRGIHTASISGIADNQSLPDDLTHLHLLIIYLSL